MTTCAKIALVMFIVTGMSAKIGAQVPEKDYLTAQEADKIRDAETSNERIKLFVDFADDRLKKFQYELNHPSPTNHEQMLNYLMNAYIGCVDDAARQRGSTTKRSGPTTCSPMRCS